MAVGVGHGFVPVVVVGSGQVVVVDSHFPFRQED